MKDHGWTYKNSKNPLRNWDYVAPNGTEEMTTPDAFKEVHNAMNALRQGATPWKKGDPWCLHPDVKDYLSPGLKLQDEVSLGRMFEQIWPALKGEGWKFKSCKTNPLVDWLYCPPDGGEKDYLEKQECMRVVLAPSEGESNNTGGDWLHGKSVSTKLFDDNKSDGEDATTSVWMASLKSLIGSVQVGVCLPSSLNKKSDDEVLALFEIVKPLLASNKWNIFSDKEVGIKYSCSFRDTEGSSAKVISDKECITHLVALKQQNVEHPAHAALSKMYNDGAQPTNKRKRSVTRKSWQFDRLDEGPGVPHSGASPAGPENVAIGAKKQHVAGDTKIDGMAMLSKKELQPWEQGDNLVLHPAIAHWLPSYGKHEYVDMQWSFDKMYKTLKTLGWKHKKGKGLVEYVYSPDNKTFLTPVEWVEEFLSSSRNISSGYVTEPYINDAKLHPMIARHIPPPGTRWLDEHTLTGIFLDIRPVLAVLGWTFRVVPVECFLKAHHGYKHVQACFPPNCDDKTKNVLNPLECVRSVLGLRIDKCPKDHQLQEFATPSTDHWCDLCQTPQLEGATMQGCRICNYDVCSVCLIAT